MPSLRSAPEQPVSKNMASRLAELAPRCPQNGPAIMDLLLAEAAERQVRPGLHNKRPTNVLIQDIVAVKNRLFTANPPLVLPIGSYHAAARPANPVVPPSNQVPANASAPPPQPAIAAPTAEEPQQLSSTEAPQSTAGMPECSSAPAARQQPPRTEGPQAGTSSAAERQSGTVAPSTSEAQRPAIDTGALQPGTSPWTIQAKRILQEASEETHCRILGQTYPKDGVDLDNDILELMIEEFRSAAEEALERNWRPFGEAQGMDSEMDLDPGRL
ncbi:MAG: hypothetical protein FRX48_07193 [Lasallia pustulata]|uniref:Uncharacterized protein n=1 Tax=Lasallia pustulata TaxID=136370 RepID=A0A5M8PHH1_9LECA|nr:MAG: hypothetical protein FRX48_07193 [Lasallia pustulata]